VHVGRQRTPPGRFTGAPVEQRAEPHQPRALPSPRSNHVVANAGLCEGASTWRHALRERACVPALEQRGDVVDGEVVIGH